jgi:hypothetical protein
MTITANALRSGISEMSAHSRISIQNNELGKLSFKQRFACHFSKTESHKANQETINALKTAILNDPRYSGIQDKINLAFDGISSKNTIRAKDVKKVFSTLDRYAFTTDAGKRSFLVQDIKMRLMAGAFSTPVSKKDVPSEEAWAFNFKNEWKTGTHPVGCDSDLIHWAPHFQKLEPLIRKMVDELAARKGGALNISALDAKELSWKVFSMLSYLENAITTSSIHEKYYSSAFEMLANTIANSPKATATPLAILQTADSYHEVLGELAAFEKSLTGSLFAVENGIAWMNAMCAPLHITQELPVFTENHMQFADAVKLGLSPEKAQRLTFLSCCEFHRSSRTQDMEHNLLNADSIPRQLLNYPDLARTEIEYRPIASFLERLDKENIDFEMKNSILDSMACIVRTEGKLPNNGVSEAILSSGEHLRFEWSFRDGYAESISINRFNQVA